MADVLIVDDEPAILELMTMLVERLGHDVRTADSAEAALMASAERRPDLLLLDLSLPGRDGDDLVALLMRGFGVPRSIVVVSADTKDRVHEVADRFGARHLHKPFPLDDLGRIVTEALDEVVDTLLELPHGPAAARGIAGPSYLDEVAANAASDVLGAAATEPTAGA